MKQQVEAFVRAIGEPTRLEILRQLRSDNCVGDLWQCLDLSQNLVSHHLKVLREAGLIDSRKDGLRSFYHIYEKALKKNLKLLTDYLK
jgi:ArsR family transcriptional regulator